MSVGGKEMIIKIGQVIAIYKDPITKNRKEGMAKITRIIGKPTDNLQLCEVKFTDDGFETLRTIDTTETT